MSDKIYLEKVDDTVKIIINRPEKKNAMTLDMFRQLDRIVDEIKADKSIRIVIVRGIDHTAFSAGADIDEFLAFRYQPDQAQVYNDAALAAIENLYRLPVPTIALIQTLAICGGLELANACDFRFASPGAKLGITAANIGIVYNLTSTKRLYNLIGPSKTKELLFTAKLISAEEGKSIGLIDYIYPKAEIEEKCAAFAASISKKSSVANAGLKQVLQAVMDGDNTESDELAKLILDSFASDDYEEGIAAFLEKRPQQFK